MKFSSQKISSVNTVITIILLTVISAASIIDVLAVRILGLIGPDYSILVSVITFVIIFGIFVIAWIIVLRAISSFKTMYDYNSSKSFRLLYKVLVISPFLGSAIVIAIVFEMIKSENYHIILIPMATFASYIPAIMILSILVLKLIVWFNRKHDYIMFSYTIALAAVLINAIFIIANMPAEMYDYLNVRESMTVQDRIAGIGVPNQYFMQAYQYSSFISFILMWFATAILLRHYSKKVGKVIYWILVAVPLLYFLGQSPPIFNYIFSAVRDADPLLYSRLSTLVFGLTKAAGGIFFAVGFWTIAESINNKQIRNYLRLSGYGILLLFVATQANSVIISPYPPFGIIGFLSMALASLLTFVGLYFTALSVSKETELRIEIDKKITQLSFIKKMGIAQLENDLYRQILPIIEKTSKAEDSIPTSLENEDIKLFVKEALEAAKKTKTH